MLIFIGIPLFGGRDGDSRSRVFPILSSVSRQQRLVARAAEIGMGINNLSD
jgi:hypothetical protein